MLFIFLIICPFILLLVTGEHARNKFSISSHVGNDFKPMIPELVQALPYCTICMGIVLFEF